MLLVVGNRYIETDAIAAASYRPGRDPIYNDDGAIIREGTPPGLSLRLVSGGFDYEFEGDDVLPIKTWLDDRAAGEALPPAEAPGDPTKPGTREKNRQTKTAQAPAPPPSLVMDEGDEGENPNPPDDTSI